MIRPAACLCIVPERNAGGKERIGEYRGLYRKYIEIFMENKQGVAFQADRQAGRNQAKKGKPSIVLREIVHGINWFKGIPQCKAQTVFGSGNGTGYSGTGQAKFTCNIFLRHALEQVQYADLILGACQRFCHA